MNFVLHRFIPTKLNSFNMRPIEDGEYIYNKQLDITIVDNRDLPVRMQEKGWVLHINGIIAGVVKGRPGTWFLHYVHEKAGLKCERINIPRVAKYRMLQIIEQNPRS